MNEQENNSVGRAVAHHGLIVERFLVNLKRPVFWGVFLLTLLGWFVVFIMAVRVAHVDAFSSGPGAYMLRQLPQFDFPAPIEALLQLCAQPVTLRDNPFELLVILTVMWFLMSFVMMLPSAAPMIKTYCEIYDTARRQEKAAVSPLVLFAGYIVAWLAMSACFAVLNVMLNWFFVNGQADMIAPVKGIAGAIALALAGLYQFSSLKQACLKKCGNPFAVLFGSWSTQVSKVFILGIRQGVWCIGCCWALMLVMFAVGIMNIFWMALLAMVAIVEKQPSTGFITRIIGFILLLWAGGLLLMSL